MIPAQIVCSFDLVMAGLAQGLQVVHVVEQIKIAFMVLLMIDDRRPWFVQGFNTKHATNLACVSIPLQDSWSDAFDPTCRLVEMAVYLAVRVAAQSIGLLVWFCLRRTWQK